MYVVLLSFQKGAASLLYGIEESEIKEGDATCNRQAFAKQVASFLQSAPEILSWCPACRIRSVVLELFRAVLPIVSCSRGEDNSIEKDERKGAGGVQAMIDAIEGRRSQTRKASNGKQFRRSSWLIFTWVSFALEHV